MIEVCDAAIERHTSAELVCQLAGLVIALLVGIVRAYIVRREEEKNEDFNKKERERGINATRSK